MELSVQERGWTPPGAPPPGPPQAPVPPRGHGWARTLVALLGVGAIALSGYVGYAVKRAQDARSTPPVRSAAQPFAPATGRRPSNSANDGLSSGAIASALDDSIVNITTTLDSGGSAAGTGIVISSSGLVLTNNHVIADTTSIRVESSATGNTANAAVLGYDTGTDVALIKIEHASGFTAAPIASENPAVGDAVVALGNAGGQGGSPAVAEGQVTDLDQQITASDVGGSNPETLSHLIEINAPIQPGDSGGPLANRRGQVIGMDVAASRTTGRFGQFDAGTGYAIPIADALAVAHKIESGTASGTIHVGATRGLLGVQVTDDSRSGSGSADDGALVVGVVPNSGAEAAGIQEGDLIVRVNGTSIGSPTDLRSVLDPAGPHATVSVTWVDNSGSTHRASVHLSPGPPA